MASGGKKKLTSKMVFLGQIKCYIMLLIRHFEAMLALCNITQLQKSNAMSQLHISSMLAVSSMNETFRAAKEQPDSLWSVQFAFDMCEYRGSIYPSTLMHMIAYVAWLVVSVQK